VKIVGERGECAVIGEALENLADVGDPEGALEAVADFLEPLAKAHDASWVARPDNSRGRPCTPVFFVSAARKKLKKQGFGSVATKSRTS
jgi:hypothetical protein